MEVSVGEIVCGQHFVELDDLLREASGDQDLGLFDQLQLVLVHLNIQIVNPFRISSANRYT